MGISLSTPQGPLCVVGRLGRKKGDWAERKRWRGVGRGARSAFPRALSIFRLLQEPSYYGS